MTEPAAASAREILRLAVPAFLALVAEPLFLLVDSAIVGHLGTTALAGLGLASSILLTASGICVFLAYATTSVVARHLGAGSTRAALAAGVDGLWLSILLGVLVGAVVLLGAGVFTGWLANDPAVLAQARTYLRVAAIGLPGMLVVLAVTGVLRGLQDTRTPLVVSVCGFAANAALNLLFVYGVGLGIAGSATGTVIAQSSMGAALALVLIRAARRELAVLRPQVAGILRAALGGLPLLVRTAALRAVTLAATAVAAGYGEVTLAAHQLALTVWSFLAFALDALAIAAQAMTGRTLGAGDAAGARRTAARVTRWGVLAGLASGIVLAALSPVAGRLFTSDPQVAARTVGAFVVIAATQWLAGYVFVLDGVLMGAGDAVFIAAAMVSAVVVWVGAVALLARHGHALPGSSGQPLVGLWVWFAGGFMLLRAVGLWWRVRTDRWAVTGSRAGA